MLQRLAAALANLTWVSAGFGWLSVVAPIIIASPMYFSGELSFGGLMMAVGAFNQVNQALRWYVINFSVIADWRATLARVSFFRNALLAMDTPAAEGEVISHRMGPPEEGISLRGVAVYGEPDKGEAGHGTRMGDDACTIMAGERVMINGDPGVDRHLFFAALAGTWPWGRGEITLPQGETMILMPQEGYLPFASLREAMTYPAGATGISDEAQRTALEVVGLERYADRLDAVERWDRLLDKEEEAALQVANVLLRKPQWLVIDDVLEGLEPQVQARLVEALATLEGSTIIYVGHSQAFSDAMSPKLLHLAPLQPGEPVKEDAPEETEG